MKDIVIKVGIPMGEDEIIWAEALNSVNSNDLGCLVSLKDDLMFEIVEISKDGKIIALLPLSESGYRFGQLVGHIAFNTMFEGSITDFRVFASGKKRRLIEEGETHAEFIFRMELIKGVEEGLKFFFDSFRTNEFGQMEPIIN